MDLMAVAKDIIGMNYDTLEALTLLVISYLIILLPLAIIFKILEKRLQA
jgi:polar amino acid transport system permease protein